MICGLMNRSELADALQVNESTVRKWARTGRIPEIRISRTCRRYAWGDVLQALREQPGG
jgi:predicted site-specific integrase-resolvase